MKDRNQEIYEKTEPARKAVQDKERAVADRLNALNVTRDELLDAILSAMNTAQLSGQVDWPQPMDGILSAWAAQGEGDKNKQDLLK